jgi:superfamily II DNA/RNA helicase
LFDQFQLHDRLLKALEPLGYSEPTDVQREAIPAAMTGQDLKVSSETGSGKTAAFLLPTLHKLLQKDAPKAGTRALILTPTRELCRQVVKHCKQLAAFTHLEVNAITGGHDFKYQRAIFRKNPEILVATPGRLKEHIERGSPDFNDLEVLILDEADRMLDMGFMDEVMEIAASCNPERQTLLFSATLDGQQYVGESLLRDPQTIALAKPRQASGQVKQQIVLSDDEKHKNKLLLKLFEQVEYDKAIIFTNTKAQANKLAGWLRYMKLEVGVLHGDMDQDARNNEMNRLRRGRVKMLVATDVAARGLDIKGMDLVINYDLARSSEDFVHRVGRTGRAGEEGLAISFITHRDWDLMVRFERELQIRFEKRKVPGLEAKFKGPKKVKASGKKAGVKKRSGENSKEAGKGNEKVKKRHRDTKNIGKRRAPSAKPAAGKWGDGFAPAPIKKKPARLDQDED